MVHEAITVETINANNPPEDVSNRLKQDIGDLFNSADGVVVSVRDVCLQGEPNTSLAFGRFNTILGNNTLGREGIFTALQQMNENNMLLHMSRTQNASGMFGSVANAFGFSHAAPNEDLIQSMASEIFARIQYNRILELTSGDDAHKLLKKQLEDRKKEVIELLVSTEISPENIMLLLENVKAQDKNKEEIATAMEALGLERDKANELFVENQYNRIRGADFASNPKLHEQLGARREHVIAALILANKDNAGEIDLLVEAVKNPATNKQGIIEAMQALGLGNDGENVKALFAENQYNRILATIERTNPKLHEQLGARREHVIAALILANKDNAGEIDLLVDAVKNPASDKQGIIEAMQVLDLGDDENFKALFAENQYNRILAETKDTNPKLYKQLEYNRPAVLGVLLRADNLAAVNGLMDAVKNTTTNKTGIGTAMQNLGLPLIKESEDKTKEIFAENQYNRILAETKTNNPILHEQLRLKPNEVVAALILANKDNSDQIDYLVKAVKNQQADKEKIKAAMKDLGLESTDSDKVNELFAEAQHKRILGLATAGTQLNKWVATRKEKIQDALKQMSTVAEVTGVFEEVKKPGATKEDIAAAMSKFGKVDADDVNLLFADNQYERTLKRVEKTNPILHEQLKLRPKEVIKKLVSQDNSTAIDALVDKVTDENTDMLGIRGVMDGIGLDHMADDKFKALFAENQYNRILKYVKETNPKLHQHLSNKKEAFITALIKENIQDLDVIDLFVSAVTSKDSDKSIIKNLMTKLGLGEDAADVAAIFGENQYNELAKQMREHETKNPQLYAYYQDAGKKEELIKALGHKDNALPANDLDKIVELLLSEPGVRIQKQQDFSQAIKKHVDKLQPIDDLDEIIHLYNPEFQQKARKDSVGMKERYQGLSKECAVMISQLNLHLKELDAIKEDMRRMGSSYTKKEATLNHLSVTQQADLAAPDGRIRKQIKEQLDFYERVKQKIDDHILPAIDNAAKGSKKYLYKPDTVESYILPRNELKESTFRDNSAPHNVFFTLPGNSEIHNFTLEEKLTPDQVRCFDVGFTHSNENGEDVKTEGRFTYDPNPPGASDSSMLKGSEIIKSTPSKFEILQFPQQPKHPPQLDPTDLKKARLEFSMAMAIQALATLDSPPTKDKPLCIRGFSGKEEEVKYLWTALVILGERNDSKMKFTPDALLVRGNSGFDPKSERGVVYGFKDTSLKTQLETELGDVVKNQAQELAKMTAKRFDSKAINQVEKSSEAASTVFREVLLADKSKEQIERAQQVVTDEEQSRSLQHD